MIRLVGTDGGSRYMILVRPHDTEYVNESRADDLAIVVDTARGVRWPPSLLQVWLKFGIWYDCGHNDTQMAELLALPEVQQP